MKKFTRVLQLGTIGAAIASALTISTAAFARDRGAGVGYIEYDLSYCSTYLTSWDQGSPINLRQGPSTGYQIQHYGYGGDWVDILNANNNPNQWMSGQDSQGYLWYQVGFPSSGAYGWVRADFLQLPPAQCRN
jgi:hypothetical protein